MKVNSILFIIIILILSCKNQDNKTELTNNNPDGIEQTENPTAEIQKTPIDKNKIIKEVQGKWKEIEYPYRTAEFVRSTVKFVEEGTSNNPVFEPFEIAEECPFENNNTRNLTSGDIILSLPESGRCEKLQITNDTLIMSGFSTHTKGNYNIIYLKN